MARSIKCRWYFRRQPLLMEWCLDCHRNPEASFARQLIRVFNMDWNAPSNQAEIGKRLAAERNIRTNSGADQLLDLSSIMDGMRENDLIHGHSHDTNTRGIYACRRSFRCARRRFERARASPWIWRQCARNSQSKTGKQYWRTLEELADDPDFEDLLHREFPRQAPSEWDETRRPARFPEARGSFAGFCGHFRLRSQAGACSIVPYVKQPDGMILGKPQFYATVDAVRRGCRWSAC